MTTGERPGMTIERRRVLRSARALLGFAAADAMARNASAREHERKHTHEHERGPRGDAFAAVRRGTRLSFPRDHGAHPAFRTEWWYLTGWLRRLDGPHRGDPAGVQVTFFRSRTRHDPDNPSRFAPTQLLFAHAALAMPERGRLLHAQRAGRAGLGLAEASETDTAIAIGQWTLQREANDDYVAKIDAGDFALDLAFRPRHTPLLQGDAGFSRKGPAESQASFYYSRPQMRLTGHIVDGSKTTAVDGITWLDHEWSSEILDASASGWDWVGLNLDDGSALMAFRIRRRDGGVLWSDARWSRPARDAVGDPARDLAREPKREPAGTSASGSGGWVTEPRAQQPVPQPHTLARFEPLRHWTSPRTGTRYPVHMRITVGDRTLTLEPLFDNQELDTRGTTGVVYWEGAVLVVENGSAVGRGYLELTGYGEALRM